MFQSEARLAVAKMMGVANDLAGSLPDLAILAMAAAFFAIAGTFISFVAHHTWFQFWPVRSSADNRIAQTAETSMLGFTAFILALSVTNVLSNLAKVEDAVVAEGTEIARLDRELRALGALAEPARAALVDYAKDVSGDEWPLLGTDHPRLSPLVQRDLDKLWSGIRSAQRDTNLVPPQVRDALDDGLRRIEHYRSDRLAAATTMIPLIFWITILLFLFAASFMNGRSTLHRLGVTLLAIHMSAIGVVVALIVIVDNPFRGATSVDSWFIANAIADK